MFLAYLQQKDGIFRTLNFSPHNKKNNTPVIIGATETISKAFRQYLSNIPGKHEIKGLRKTAIPSTAHKLREC